MIVILSMLEDVHARAVCWALERVGIECAIVDFQSFPCAARISIESREGTETISFTDHHGRPRKLAPADVSAVWRRRKCDKYFNFLGLSVEDLSLGKSETECFAENVIQFFERAGNARLVNRFDAAESLGKLCQLDLARRAGLAVPDTLASNDPDLIRTFYRSKGRMILTKPFKSRSWQENGETFVQQAALLGPEHEHMLDDTTLSLAPSIYQEFIKKDHELRITVIGDECHVARIETRSSPLSTVDSRGGLFVDTPISKVDRLDDDLETRILEFMRLSRLEFCCIDMAVGTCGTPYFLEANEQGQFLWVEERCADLKLLDSFSRHLSNRKSTLAPVSFREFTEHERASGVRHVLASRRATVRANIEKFGGAYAG